VNFEADGAERFLRVLDQAQLSLLVRALGPIVAERPGVRIAALPSLSALLGSGGAIGGLAAAALGAEAKPVRAVLFDKTALTNWGLGWHQDRTISVRARHEVAGFGPWSRKDELQHVEPPFAVLENMVTLRVHIDPVDEDNAPLLILPGTHRLGRLAVDETLAAAARVRSVTCLADAGDVWVYATPIVHASEAARAPRRRRVLQLDYAAQALPGGLEWAEV
jgi:hypothetical protein